tara:strand:- start:2292 stop:3338 length:1047 start_codon:yes stop_codon:yes gene_type:complete
MKKILVTGGCGFIGSNFILNHINQTNDKIFNIDKLTYAGNLKNLESLDDNKNYSFKKCDIIDSKNLRKVFNEFRPEVIVNFAAESHVDRSIDGPASFINTNILGTFNLLQITLDYYKSYDFLKFIHISTDEVFGSLSSKQAPSNENNRYNPSSPYSSSKASSDHLVNAWGKTYGLPITITNCSNNYGPYQFPEKLIPLVIANCFDEKPIPVYGDGKNIRDWLFVKDHCNAIDKIINKGIIGETYNIGGDNELKNIDIVRKICTILDDIKPRSNGRSYVNLISYVKDRPGHDFRYAIDSSKIKNELKWMQRETFETGLMKTLKWYIKNETWWRNIQRKSYNQERLGLKS